MMNRGSRFPSRFPSRLAVGGTTLALLPTLALTACSGNSPARTHAAAAATNAARSAASAVAAARSGSGTKAGTKGGTVKIPRYVAAENVRRYVSTTSCVQVGGGWRLRGTATNASSSARAYSIVVDFVTATGDTVLDTKLLNVGPVAPKSVVGWSVTGAAGQHHVTCVIRQALAR
jgi:hypothetical protein